MLTHTSVKLIVLLSLCCSLLVGCTERSYENKALYELKVNETVEIYYSTNSCCHYCFAEEQDLNHIEYVEEKTVDSGPRDCDGCNYVAAYVFRARTPGTDTVQLKSTAASQSCPDADQDPETFVIVVTE